MNTAVFILACLLPPSPAADTPDHRLRTYYHEPEAQFCYKWHPDEMVRVALHSVWVAKRGQGK